MMIEQRNDWDEPTEHHFKVGQTISMFVGLGSVRSLAKIVRLMPSGREVGDPQYRVKAASENHERMVTESGMTEVD